MITIFDYGAGNLRSVQNTLDEVGCEYIVVRDAAGVRAATRLVLPGVGHFGQMMRALDTLEVRGALIERIRAGVPFLGICLGMQALFESSEEAPAERGLAIYPGVVRRFTGDTRIPQMGWNQLEIKPGSRLFANLPPDPFMYFAHSYYVPEQSIAAATCTYGTRYTAALEAGQIFGVQFHPEKSAANGLAIVRNFASLPC